MKGRSLVDCCFDPDSAAMPVNDPLHDGKAHAGAFELFWTVHPLEGAEELARVFHIESRAVVANGENELVSLFLAADIDHGVFTFPREFDRIADEISQHLMEQRTVAETLGQFPQPKVDLPAFPLAGIFFEHLLD